MKVQKFRGKLKNIPRGAPQAPCSTSLSLNRDQSLSVADKVRTLNNSDVDLLHHTGGLTAKAYVLAKQGTPLMPCSFAKARHLIEGGKAYVVTKKPFTIQLTFECENQTQDVTLGVDPGYSHIGLSAITKKKTLFFSEEELRTNIPKLISEKRMYRRNRRNKLWYRKPRFNNRVSTKSECWLAPSIQHRLDSHIRIIDKIHTFLPISEIIVEVAAFDIQKIMNPDIEGVEYQNGVQKDFENVRAYVLYRDHHTCQHCGKQNVKLRVHHLESRQTGGNRPDNLITLCKECHDKLHAGKITVSIKKRGFKAETFMSILRWKLLDRLKQKYKNVGITFGYITKAKRMVLNLDKTHSNDAFVIAGGEDQLSCREFHLTQKRRNNRSLQLNRKGFKPSIRRQHYKIQPHDLIRIKGIEYISKGSHNKGKSVVCIDKEGNKFDFNTRLIDSIFNVGGLVWNGGAIPPSPKGEGILAQHG